MIDSVDLTAMGSTATGAGSVSGDRFDGESQATLDVMRIDDPTEVALGSSSIFDAQIWMGRSPWQPAAGWSVVAALLTWVPLTQWFGAGSGVDWRLIALVLLLVDPLWGGIWRFSTGRSAVLPLQPNVLRRRFWLPYISGDSPAARLMGGDIPQNGDPADERAQSVYPVLLRVALPSVLLALAVAAVLGTSAVWMTCAVVLVTVLAWTRYSNSGADQQGGSYLLRALITVALPWGLALLQMQSAPMGESALFGPMRFSWLLLGLWTLHSWGEGRCLQSTTDRLGIGLLAVSTVGMAILLIVLGMPISLGILAVIWFATWFSIFNGSSLERIQGWWLVAMLVSAASVGFSG